MPEETEAQVSETQTLPTPEVKETPPVPEVVKGDEKPHELEPGGDRFKQVWARAKKAEEEARAERDGRIAAEARAKALEDAATAKPKEPPKRYTTEQVQKAVEAGTVSQIEAMDYIAETKALEVQEKAETRRQDQERIHRPLAEAQKEKFEYWNLMPELRGTDKSNPKFLEAVNVYQELTQRFGMPENDITEVQALRQVVGPLSVLKQRQESRDMTRTAADLHTETGAGGEAGRSGGADPLAKVPARYKEYWEKRGMTKEEMVKEAKYIPKDRLERK